MKQSMWIIIATGYMLAGCTGMFDEINRNPNAINEINPQLLLPKMQYEVINANAYEYQRGENLFANQYCQWVANTAPYFNSDRYEYNSEWVTIAYWSPYYTYVLKEFLDVRRMVETHPEYQEMYHIARIVAALGAARTTDLFGDVPYSEASRGLDKSKYDAQKDIYYDILKELTEATEALSAGFDHVQLKYGASDFYYNGEADAWIRFGNSLRLRYALRIAFIDPGKAQQEGEAALSRPMMTHTGDNACLVTSIEDDGHPLFVISNWSEFRMSATLENAYKTLSAAPDPRMECYWGVTEASVAANTPAFKGVRNGLPSDQLPLPNTASSTWGLLWAPEWNSSHIKPVVFTAEYPLYAMCYSEVCFLKAEAGVRGWAGAGNVQANYENGIRASFAEARWNVNPALYSTANDETYIATGSVKWNEGADFETKLEKIATQKWLALFPNGTEAWAEVRRTGYPKLTPIARSEDPAINVANGEFIKKLRYVNIEREINGEHATSPNLNGGKGDGQHVRVWWDTGRYK
ncbi:MAG: SusD/RagB family nutrient-binding outer membrane lipoprotein [Prevotellaceae bacterium]|nr:SusD/RagB family nutrient-binding outer membrane lipoprotein [Prevotellaceae bacterium]